MIEQLQNIYHLSYCPNLPKELEVRGCRMRIFSLSAVIFAVQALLQNPAMSDDSFIRYPWACPNSEAHEEAWQAFDNLDDRAFSRTGCVSIRPKTEYRILRCDPEISEKHLEKFGYEIERTEELKSLLCEISVNKTDGHTEILLITFGKLFRLKPQPN